MSKHSLIRTIYLYIFALLGLVLMVIGGVQMVGMALKAWIFTKADADMMRMSPVIPPDKEATTSNEVVVDYRTQQRHRDASQSLAFILIGLPLYLYHWGVIKKEMKAKSG